MASDKHVITSNLYSKVENSLKRSENKKAFKDNIDKYLAYNADKYFTLGPGERPIFYTSDKEKFYEVVGLSADEITKVIKDSKSIGSNWYIMNEPFNSANVLATRYFLLKKDKEYVDYAMWYLVVSMYPMIHHKYWKYGVNEACMNYTINNLSEKFKIKQYGNLWNTFVGMLNPVYDFYKDKLPEGSDAIYIKYIQDVHTRINSLLKNISVEYYDNWENQRYLKLEKESYDEDNYYEADSNSQAIERITNKVVTHLVVNGPDMKLVELAAKTNQVSINEMRNYTQSMINEKQRDDIRDIVEAILFLYLFNDDGELHSVESINTNNFMIYCLQIYKRSNTSDKNIIKIKSILDRWLKELGLMDKTSRVATVKNFRKALYTFFVMSIQKIA